MGKNRLRPAGKRSSRIGWRQGRMAKFDGVNWVFFDDVITVPEAATRG